MTLVIAIPSIDFIVVGADSRAMLQDAGGTRVEINEIKKIVKIAKHVVVLLYGVVDQANYIVREFDIENKGTDGVTRVAKKFARFCRKEMKEIPRESIPSFGFIIAGLDKHGSKYSIPNCYTLYSQSGFTLGLPPYPYVVEGKPLLALFILQRQYKPAMQYDKLCKLVGQCIYDTVCVDGDVGGRIRVGIIDDERGFRELPFSDIRNKIEQWGEPLIR